MKVDQDGPTEAIPRLPSQPGRRSSLWRPIFLPARDMLAHAIAMPLDSYAEILGVAGAHSLPNAL
jgi:hypothetical protein